MFRKIKKKPSLKDEENSEIKNLNPKLHIKVAIKKDDIAIVNEAIITPIITGNKSVPVSRSTLLAGSFNANSRLGAFGVAKGETMPSALMQSERTGANRKESASSDISELLETAKLTEYSLGFSTDIMEENADVSSSSESEEDSVDSVDEPEDKKEDKVLEKSSPTVSSPGETTKAIEIESPHTEDKSFKCVKEPVVNVTELIEKEKSETLVQKEAPVKEKTFVQEEAPVKEKTHAQEEASIKEKTPVPVEKLSNVERERSNTPVPQLMIKVAEESSKESYSTERGGGESEIITESAPPVKDQIAMFSQMKLQETHGKPKPGVAAAFAPKITPEKRIFLDRKEIEPGKLSNESVFKNSTPVPFQPADSVQKPFDIQQPVPVSETKQVYMANSSVDVSCKPITPNTAPKQVYMANSSVDVSCKPITRNTAPKQVYMTKQPAVKEPEWDQQQSDVMTRSASHVASFNGSGVASVPMTAQKIEATGPYLGSDIISCITGPSVLIRLRRSSQDAPWGFAIFGGSDYGCPPFISRLTLNTIASDAGLEVGDVIVSICNLPVQGKEHAHIKAEILRAGNEIDFLIVKQGIDKQRLSERAPQLIQPNSALRKNSASLGNFDFRRGSGSQVYRPVQTKSLRLLDEHLDSLSTRQPYRSNIPQPSANIFPAQSYQNYSSSKSTTYQTSSSANRTAVGSPYQQYHEQNQPLNQQTVYAQPSFAPLPRVDNSVPEMRQSRTYYATPARSTQNIYLSRGDISQNTVSPRVQSQPRPFYPTARQHGQLSPKVINYRGIVASNGATVWGGESDQQRYLSTSPQTSFTGNWSTPMPKSNYYDVSSYQEPEHWSTMGTVHTSTTGWM